MVLERNATRWPDVAALIGRVIFAAVFLIALTFKILMPAGTAAQIAAVGFPAPQLLGWLAALFELGLVLAFLTGAYFREACLAAVVYVIFLAGAFHGPSKWAANQNEFGFFIDHFTFTAGLLFAAAHGPGRWALRRSLLVRSG